MVFFTSHDSSKRCSQKFHMALSNENTKQNAIYSLIYIIAALSIIIMQPGFMSMAYSGAAEKDVELRVSMELMVMPALLLSSMGFHIYSGSLKAL